MNWYELIKIVLLLLIAAAMLTNIYYLQRIDDEVQRQLGPGRSEKSVIWTQPEGGPRLWAMRRDRATHQAAFRLHEMGVRIDFQKNSLPEYGITCLRSCPRVLVSS
ncbi:MAG: hypothetical protein ACR2PG_12170 [Hyphomicrobiaceae bacterium]